MAISFVCSCGQLLEVPDHLAGNQVDCPACARMATVPGRMTAVPRRPASRSRPALARDREDDYAEGPGPTNGKATTSLVLGILSLLGGLLFGVPAIIFGVLANKEISRSRGREFGQGLATTGIVMGGVGGVLSSFVLWMYFFNPDWVSPNSLAAERAQSQNNLKQMALSIIQNADENNGRLLEEGAIKSKDGRPLLSWRVAILPYIEQQALYRQFHLDEPWDSEHNRPLLSQMPKVFAHPGFPKDTKQGLTHYRAIVGPGTGFAKRSRYPASFSDGTSQTVMLVEAEEAVPWTSPEELVYDPKGPLPRFSQRHKAGFCVALWDCSVRTVFHTTSEATLRAAFTASGNEILGSDW